MADCILAVVPVSARGQVFVQRELQGVLDDGSRHGIVIWIERRTGALWAVGRAIEPEARRAAPPPFQEYVFEGTHLGAALDAANRALEADLAISAEEGVRVHVAPFAEQELLGPLERWVFGLDRSERRQRRPSR